MKGRDGMNAMAPGFYSEPRVQFLAAVLEELRTGAIEIPRFQRPFVWDDERQLDLLRSVRDGLPIGSLMIWQTQTAVSASEYLGERRLPASVSPTHRYLLDGQQRMATLFAALIPVPEGEVGPRLTAYYDMDAEDFVLCPPGEAEARHLPLSLVLDSVKLRRFERAFPEDKAERWIESCEWVAAAFKDYKLPTIPIATDDLDLAIRTFERINRAGSALTGVHMVHALSWSEGFHLLDRLEALRMERLASINWGGIDDERILDGCRARLGMPLEESLEGNLARALRERPEILEDAVEDIARAANFLREHCEVRSPRLLPYRHQLPVVAAALRRPGELDDSQRGRLIAWFWVSSLTGWFIGVGEAARGRLREALESIQDICDGKIRRPFGARSRRSPIGPTFDVRAARGRVLVLLLANQTPRSIHSRRPIDLDPLLDQETLRIPWLMPREQFDDNASPGNRVLLPTREIPELRRILRDRSLAWSQIAPFVSSHAINEEARLNLLGGDPRAFVEARRQTLDDLEERLLKSHLSALE